MSALLKPIDWSPLAPPPVPKSWPVDFHEKPLLLLIDRRDRHTPEALIRLKATLSEAEQQRYYGYPLRADRERFLLGRGGIRMALATMGGVSPRSVKLAYGPCGKPKSLGGPEFNISHSGDLILLAVHPLHSVGVDIERLRAELDWQSLANRFLDAAGIEAIRACQPQERVKAFITAWCHLEAEVKAEGSGLTEIIKRSRNHGQSRAKTRIYGLALSAKATAKTWLIDVPDGYRGAVAIIEERV